MDFLKIVYVTGGHCVCFSSPSFSCFLMSFFPFLMFFFPPSPSSLFALFSRSPFCSFFPVLHSYVLFRSVYYFYTLITFSCPSFLSSTLFSFLPLYYHSVRPSYVSFSFDCFINFFVSFDISCYKYYLIFY